MPIPGNYTYAQAVAKSDTVDFPKVGASPPGSVACADALYVGGAGDVVAVMDDNSTVTLSACLAGTIYPIRMRRVNSTNTTATLLAALYYR